MRVGLAGGLVFGAAFAAAIALLQPGRLRDPSDFVVLMSYVAAAAALALGVLALAAGVLAGWLGRRLGHRPGPTLSRNVGLALGILGTTYLALWWRSHAAAAPLGLQLALAVAGLGLAWTLTRFGSLAAVAVLSAGGLGDRLPEARETRRHMTRLVAVTLLVLAGAAAAASRRSEHEPAGPDYAVKPTGLS